MKREMFATNNNSLERYRKFAKNYYRSVKSAGNRISAVKLFIDFLNNEERNVARIDHGSVEDFFVSEFNKDKSLVTIQNYYSYLKGFFTFLKEQDDNITLNYDKVNFDRVKNSEIEIFSDNEISEIFRIINYEKNDKKRLSNMMIFKILFYNGCTVL